ncbi:MAG: M18 family aminopeptidase [Lachnospiraceae bacterium]|nr:M18 family aminopeptidase [Lachnospiraceae bacterium]
MNEQENQENMALIGKSIDDLKNMVRKGTSPYHVVAEAAEQLRAAGFKELPWVEMGGQEWELKKGGAYFVAPFRTSLMAFRIDEGFNAGQSLRMVSAHVDSPGLRIKAKAEYPYKSYQRVNTEVYGGAINHTWMDRPLGMAGIVAIRQSGSLTPRIYYLDCQRPIFIIPNLSIHMNREINKGTEFNPQVDLIPVGGIGIDDLAKEAFFTNFLAEEINRAEAAGTKAVNDQPMAVQAGDIISYDCGLYVIQEGLVCGMHQEMLAAPRLDNLTSVQAGLTALIDGHRSGGINLLALFDHEEIGSRSKSGGAGNILPLTLERIYHALGYSRSDYLRAIAGGFLLSADTAHAVNPNHPEKYDPTTGIGLGEGVAIKCAAKQSYAGDAETWALLQNLADRDDIPCRLTYIRSDIPGGSTLGPILSSALPMRSADIGVPMLAMHSAVETIGCRDQYYLERFLKVFFTSEERLI